MTRNGKIARLPKTIREQINVRLQGGEEAKQLAVWLNALPEALAVLEAEFKGQRINETNLSNWKLGGYRDWELQQEALEAVRRLGADAAELRSAGGDALADQLAVCLTARIAVALQAPVPERDDPITQLQRLRQLCGDLVALRKGDHNAQRLQLEREKLDLDLRKYDEEEKARKREWDEAHGPPRKGGLSEETMELIQKQMKIL